MKSFFGIRSFTLFELAGIPVVINPTWFVIFFILSATVYLSAFPSFYPQGDLVTWFIQSIIFVFLFFFSLFLHEFSHAIVAVRNGIDVANITFHLFGGTARILKEPGKPADELKMAAAGPLTSFLISAFFCGVSFLFHSATEPLKVVFYLLSAANLGIGFFNLLPAYPLDGGRLLRALFWFISKSRLKATIFASWFSASISIMLFGFGVFYAFSVSIDGLWIAVLSVIIFFLSREGVEIAYQNEILDKKLSEIFNLEEISLPLASEDFFEKADQSSVLRINEDSKIYDVLKSLRKSKRSLVKVSTQKGIFYTVPASRLEDMIYEKLENARHLVK